MRLARKCLIFSLLRDLVGLRFRGVKEAIQLWASASVHDSLRLESKWMEIKEQVYVVAEMSVIFIFTVGKTV